MESKVNIRYQLFPALNTYLLNNKIIIDINEIVENID